LIAEDALIKVAAKLVLIGKFGAPVNGELFHVFLIAGLNVFRYKGMVRDGLAKSCFLPLRQKSEPKPGPTSVFIQAQSFTYDWYKQNVDLELSLDDVTAEFTPIIQTSVSLLSTWNTADVL
jgi:hypothetical protein